MWRTSDPAVNDADTRSSS